MMIGVRPSSGAIGLVIALASMDSGYAALNLRAQTEDLIDADNQNEPSPYYGAHKHAQRDPDDIDERLTKQAAKLERRAKRARLQGTGDI